ncbi:MAG: hypothetical protein ACREQ5_06310 [Candidatus Dormibacteria bacterium]
MARVLNREEVDCYLDLIRKGEGLSRAARRLNVDPRTMRDNRKMNPEFDEMVKMAEAEAAEPVEIKLYQAALDGEPWAVRMWLERRSSERWSAPAASVNVNVQAGLAPGTERLLALAAQLEARRAMLMPGPPDGANVIDVEEDLE